MVFGVIAQHMVVTSIEVNNKSENGPYYPETLPSMAGISFPRTTGPKTCAFTASFYIIIERSAGNLKLINVV